MCLLIQLNYLCECCHKNKENQKKLSCACCAMYSGQQDTKKKAKEPSFGSCQNNKENKKGKADAPSLCECCHSHQKPSKGEE